MEAAPPGEPLEVEAAGRAELDKRFAPGQLEALLGRLAGLADTAAGAALALKLAVPRGYRFFSDGWGDLQAVQDSRAHFEAHVADYHASGARAPDVELGPERGFSCGKARHGQFTSPLPQYLPAECQVCHFELVYPADERPWACVIHFPGTADQSYAWRRHLIARALLQRGVASILLMPAFYGPRKPQSQRLHYIATVANFWLQSGSLLLEAMALLDWAAARFPDALLGSTGVSWGGAVASLVGCLAKRHDLAVIPFLPSASPEVLVTGALRSEIAIEALTDGTSGSRSEARSMLRSLLCSANVTDMHQLGSSLPGPGRAKAVLQVSAAHDAIIGRRSARRAFAVLAELDAEAELRWVAGGHTSSMALAPWLFVDPILSALQKLSAKLGRPCSRL